MLNEGRPEPEGLSVELKDSGSLKRFSDGGMCMSLKVFHQRGQIRRRDQTSGGEAEGGERTCGRKLRGRDEAEGRLKGHALWGGLFLGHVFYPSFIFQAETRAEFAERSVAKLEKTIDDLEGKKDAPPHPSRQPVLISLCLLSELGYPGLCRLCQAMPTTQAIKSGYPLLLGLE